MLASSFLPPSRFFPAPTSAFDTEVALVSAGNVAFAERSDPAIRFVAAEDAPADARTAIVRAGLSLDPAEAARVLIAALAWKPPRVAFPSKRTVLVESSELADALAPLLADIGLLRQSLTFFAASAADVARGERLELDSMVGDEAWRAWASVEREILAEAIAPLPLTEAQLDRSVQFKRKQQRDTPPVRRFVARHDGAPIAMVGYAPFAPVDLGLGPFGPLIRLRDVAVLPHARRHGVGAALIRGVVARAVDECRATQVLICGASEGAPAALYRRIGARPIGGCTMFSGSLS